MKPKYLRLINVTYQIQFLNQRVPRNKLDLVGKTTFYYKVIIETRL